MAIDFTSMGAGATNPAPATAPVEVTPTTPGISLDLDKHNLLNLDKIAPGLTKVDLAAQWDASACGADADLDISVFLCHEDGKIHSGDDVIFYNHKDVNGIHLDKDNRTGAGDGDDETISMDLNAINPSIHKIVCCVTIDKATERHQTFGMVTNSLVRLVNKDTNAEIARYSLKEDCKTATAIVFAELVKDNGSWVFHTIGEGLVADLNGIAARFQ